MLDFMIEEVKSDSLFEFIEDIPQRCRLEHDQARISSSARAIRCEGYRKHRLRGPCSRRWNIELALQPDCRTVALGIHREPDVPRKLQRRHVELANSTTDHL